MKNTCRFIMVLLVVTSVTFGFLNNQQEKALQYLKDRGEVYFCFPLYNLSMISQLTLELSIDDVINNTVYAYANEKEFETFLNYGYDFKVLHHPGDLIEPQMHDYKPGTYTKIDKYPTYDGYLELLNSFAKNYPKLCKIVEIGQSVKKRKVMAVVITNNVDKEEPEPKFFCSGTMHGDETEGFVLLLKMTKYLLENYQKIDQVTNILDSSALFFIPLLNPDGLYNGGNNTVKKAKRKNANGADLNRNYPDVENGNPSKFEPEIKASMGLMDQHNFTLGLDFHGGTSVLAYPPTYRSPQPPHPDEAWFEYAGNVYAEFSSKNGKNIKVQNGYDAMYEAHGTTYDYCTYFRHMKCGTWELYGTKLIPEGDFEKFWNYNREALMAYFDQMRYGIRGFIRDSLSNKGIEAKVFVENHDKDSSWVYSNNPEGNFYRPIIAGTYTVTITAKDYFPKTIENITVVNDKATVLDVKLKSKITHVKNNFLKFPRNVTIFNGKNGIVIRGLKTPANLYIYTLQGKLVKQLTNKSQEAFDSTIFSSIKLSKGFYFVKLITNGISYKRPIIVVSD